MAQSYAVGQAPWETQNSGNQPTSFAVGSAPWEKPTLLPAPTPQPTFLGNIGNIIKNAFMGGVNQVKEAVTAPPTANPATNLATGIKAGAGIINAATAPLAPVMSPIESFVNWIADKVSNSPQVQKFAQSPAGQATANVAENVGNLSTIAGAAAGVEKPNIKAPEIINKVTTPIASALDTSAESSIVKALAPTTKANKIIAAKLAPQILERPFKETAALTRQGLEQKAVAGKEIAGQAIEDFGKLTGTTDTSKVIGALESEKQQYMAGGKVVNPQAVDKINQVQDIIHQYGDKIDNETLRGVRRIFDAEINKAKGFATPPSEGTMLDIKKVASDKIRGILADTNPDLAKLNKEYTFWANLQKVISDTNTRLQGQSGLTKNLATIGGMVSTHGVVNIAIKALTFRWLASAVKSTGWKLVSAKLKSNLADAIGSSDFTTANTILRTLPAQSSFTREWDSMKQKLAP